MLKDIILLIGLIIAMSFVLANLALLAVCAGFPMFTEWLLI